MPADDRTVADAPAAVPHSARHVLYRLWNGAIPASVCRAVIDEFTDEDFYESEVERPDGSVMIDARARLTEQVFIEPAHWVGSLVSHFATQANLGWQFDLDGLGTLSILRYKVGSHFAWHLDTLAYDTTDYAQYPGRGVLERKLSVTINLSDPSDYDGGDLEFMNPTGQVISQPEIREQGSVVVFPSTLGHRVTPVTRGVRYALVGWMVGAPLR